MRLLFLKYERWLKRTIEIIVNPLSCETFYKVLVELHKRLRQPNFVRTILFSETGS